MPNRNKISLFEGVDRIAICCYFLLVLVGFVNITSASYNDELEVLSFSQNYIKQIVWTGAAFCVGLFILLLDSRFYHMYAYYAYAGGILMLIAVLLFGREVNGAKAWFEFGPVRLQTMEFAKIAIALAVARLMSEYNFNISRPKSLVKIAAMIFFGSQP